MECREIEELLSAYIDGELQGAEAFAVTEHLSRCSQCRWELLQLQETANLLRNLPEIEPPADFHWSLRQRLNSFKEDKPWYKRFNFNRWFGFGTVTAAALLLCMVVINALNPWQSLPQDSRELKQENIALQEQVSEQDLTPSDEKMATELGMSQLSPRISENLPEVEKQKPTAQESVAAKKAQEPVSSPSPQLFLASSPSSGEEQGAEESTEGQDLIQDTSLPEVEENFNYGSGFDGEEEKEAPVYLAAATKTMGRGEVHSLPTWHIYLKVKDINQAKFRLGQLMAAHGALIRNSDSAFLEVSLPVFSLDKVFNLMKHDYMLGATQVEITTGGNLPQKEVVELMEKIEFKQEELEVAKDGEEVLQLKQELKNLRWQLHAFNQDRNGREINNFLLKIYLQN